MRSSVPVIASGGVGTLDHLVDGVTEGHASAVLAASIFHFGTYSVADAHAALRAAGLARPQLTFRLSSIPLEGQAGLTAIAHVRERV